MIVASNNLFKTKAGLQECRWIAINNPNYVEFVRQDYQVMLISTAGLFTTIIINTTGISQADFEQDFEVGTSIYISAIGKTKVVAQSAYVSNNSFVRFIFDGVFYNSGNGYVNCFSRTNYFFELKYVHIIPAVTFPSIEEKIIPFIDGIAKVNISQSLQIFLTLKADDENLSLINIRDANISGKVFINYREFYRGDYQPETQVVPLFYAVNNQKKAFEKYGSCLAEYEMQRLSNNKFLTRMERPHYWAGYPFALYFIFPLSSAPINPSRLEIEQDINEMTIASGVQELELFNPNQNYEYVNSLALNGGYTGCSVLVRLITPESSGGIVNGFADQYANDYFVFINFPSIMLPEVISEFKRVYIGDCNDNPVYLRWRNSLGGFDYWLFNKRQTKTNEVDKYETFNPLIMDIETEQESESVQTKLFNKRWRLGAYLEMQSVTDIQELYTSPFVQWYNESNQLWYSVKVLQGSFIESVTDEKFYELEVTIEFPTEYNQQQ